MPILPIETPPATETPAPKEGATPDPKDGAAVVSAGEPPGAGEAATANAKPTPTKAQRDFESRLEELATKDLSLKERAKAIDLAKAKLDRYTPLDEHLTKGELKAAARKFFGEKYTADLLLELADDFAPEEVSVEERVKRTLEAERKAADEAAKKKGEEETEQHRLAVETETKAYLTATADHLRRNKDKYPLICAWDDDPDIDHERIIDRMWRDHYKRTNEVPDPEKILEQVEAAHLARIKKTSFGPREPVAPTLEQQTGLPAPSEQPFEVKRNIDPSRYRSGAEEAADRLAAWDREQQQRALLSYGR
jgi:hypothetical protein